jgi:anti-anti-sigma regulatory factor
MSSLPRSRIIEVEDVGGIAIVRFTDLRVGTHERDDFPELSEDLSWLIDDLGRHKVLLDFTGVELLPDRALAPFIALLRKIQMARGTLIFCNLPSAARELFRITRLDQLFTISPRLGHVGRAEILHKHFGVTFRPVPFAPVWRTGTAVLLAQQMYDSRDFTAMPILADALQDAGCDNADALDHCRGSGLHARGCWVVDLVLGKEKRESRTRHCTGPVRVVRFSLLTGRPRALLVSPPGR